LPDGLYGVCLKGLCCFILPHHQADHVRLNDVPLADGNDPFDGILQFPDVAGPGVPDEDFHGSPAESQAAIQPGCVPLQEDSDVLLDIFGPFPQRWEVEAQDVQPIIQVGAEPVGGNELFEILVGGGDKADVGVLDPIASQTHDLFFLDYPEQLALEGVIHFGDFVEEEGAPVGDFQETRFAFLACPREGTPDVTEQLALQYLGGKGSAVDRDERVLAAFARVVDALEKTSFPSRFLRISGLTRPSPRTVRHGHTTPYPAAGTDDVRKGEHGSMLLRIDLIADIGFPLLNFSDVLKGGYGADRRSLHPDRHFVAQNLHPSDVDDLAEFVLPRRQKALQLQLGQVSWIFRPIARLPSIRVIRSASGLNVTTWRA